MIHPTAANLEDVFVTLARKRPARTCEVERIMNGNSLLRTFSVARKELLHILRDPQTLFFTLFVPVLELFMLGYAIDTNVRNVRTVIVDYAGTQESRQLLEKFENSQDFRDRRQGLFRSRARAS